MSYVEHMKSSKYCLCPMGYEVNSPRIVEAIYYECVPVIIADNFVPPLNDVLDWSAFSVMVDEKDIPKLKEILSAIPLRRYLKMQINVKMLQKHFRWNARPIRFDMFHMILHSIWHSRLNQIQITQSLWTLGNSILWVLTSSPLDDFECQPNRVWLALATPIPWIERPTLSWLWNMGHHLWVFGLWRSKCAELRQGWMSDDSWQPQWGTWCRGSAPLQSCSSNAGMTRRFSILILEHVRCKEGHTVYEIKLFCIIIGCTERQCKKRKRKGKRKRSKFICTKLYFHSCL